jgi:hypothetical protein
VLSAIRAAHARFERSPIRDFIPLLIERCVRDDLAEIGGLLAAAQ